MTFETAWKEIYDIANVMRDAGEEEIETLILCIDYVQSELESSQSSLIH